MNLFRQNGKQYIGIPTRILKTELELEDILCRDPHILGEDLLIIGRQIHARNGCIIDLLGINRLGDIVVIELKRDRPPREVVSQLNSYLTSVEKWTEHDLEEKANRLDGETGRGRLERALAKYFGSCPPRLNRRQIGVVIGSQIEEDLVAELNGLKYECRTKEYLCFEEAGGSSYFLMRASGDSAEVTPDRAQKTKRSTRGVGKHLTELGKTYQEFFETLRRSGKQAKLDFAAAVDGSSDGWLCWSTGCSGVVLVAYANRKRTEVYATLKGDNRDDALGIFRAGQSHVENLYKGKLATRLLTGKKENQVAVSFNETVNNRAAWPKIAAWLIDNLVRFNEMVIPAVHKAVREANRK